MSCLSLKVKGLMTVLSGIMIHLCLGSVYSYTLFSPYLLSYLQSFDDTIVIDDGFWFSPIALVFGTLSMSLGGYLEKKFNPRM